MSPVGTRGSTVAGTLQPHRRPSHQRVCQSHIVKQLWQTATMNSKTVPRWNNKNYIFLLGPRCAGAVERGVHRAAVLMLFIFTLLFTFVMSGCLAELSDLFSTWSRSLQLHPFCTLHYEDLPPLWLHQININCMYQPVCFYTWICFTFVYKKDLSFFFF